MEKPEPRPRYERLTEATMGGKDPARLWADPEPKPKNYVPPQPTIIDEMLAGKKSAGDVAQSIIDEAYKGLRQYCSLPAGFADRELAYEFRSIEGMSEGQLDDLAENPPRLIIDPKRPQIEAVELLTEFLQGGPRVCKNRDPYQPIFGVDIEGIPGCGKTHIVAAFARRMKEYLDEKLEFYWTMVREFVNREYVAYQKAMLKVPNPGEASSTWVLTENDIVERKDPATVFLAKLDQFRQGLSRLQFQPTDLLYLDFEALWELCRGESATREQALKAIETAKVLFLDDVHPKGDAERLKIVLHVIEGRYAAGRMGTFITTNLTTEEMAGSDPHLASRLKSRCSEMFYGIDFKDCIDWRQVIKRRRIELARAHIGSKIASKLEGPPEQQPA